MWAFLLALKRQGFQPYRYLLVNQKSKLLSLACAATFAISAIGGFAAGVKQRSLQDKIKRSADIINLSNSAILSFREVELGSQAELTDIVRKIAYLKSREVNVSSIEQIVKSGTITKQEAQITQVSLSLILQKERLNFDGYADSIKDLIYIKEGLLLLLCAVGTTSTWLVSKESDGQHSLAISSLKSQLAEHIRIYQLTNHELRGLAQVLIFSIRALERDTANKGKAVARAQSAISRLLRVVEAMPMPGAEEIVNMASKDLVALCQEVASQVCVVAGLTQEIIVIVPLSPVYLVMNEALFSSAIYNVVENAVKYSGKSVKLELLQSEKITIKITDSGIGIPESDIDRLFDCFYRASNTGTIKGTGLGLAIVKKTIELHGGAIAVESTVGSGTTFTLTFDPHLVN